jgi:aspartate aminotransferase
MSSIPWASARSQVLQTTLAPLPATLLDPRIQAGRAAPGACDFYFGNPQEFPLPGYVEALQRWVPPQDKDGFTYKMSEPAAQRSVARSHHAWRGVDYHPEDVLMTTGAFAGLAIALHSLVDPQDEVIFLSPPWFFYEPMIQAASGTPVRVLVDRATFEMDLEAIETAISPRTRAVLVNSPNNPTGRIYSEASLRGLGQRLEAASQKHRRRIYLISDEAYSRIVFDRRTYFSPTQAYPHSLLVYTCGKTCSLPDSGSDSSPSRRSCPSGNPCARR